VKSLSRFTETFLFFVRRDLNQHKGIGLLDCFLALSLLSLSLLLWGQTLNLSNKVSLAIKSMNGSYPSQCTLKLQCIAQAAKFEPRLSNCACNKKRIFTRFEQAPQ
jgi:hypothetical protein